MELIDFLGHCISVDAVQRVSFPCRSDPSPLEIRSKIKTLVPSVSLRELDTAYIIQAEEAYGM